MSTRTVVRAGLRAGAVLALLTGIAGCTAPTAPSAAESPSASAAPSTEEPAAPVALVPGGTAEENLPFFREIVTAAAGSDPETPGRSVVDALVAAGPDCGHADHDVIDRQVLQRRRLHRTDRELVLPVHRPGLAPDDAVADRPR